MTRHPLLLLALAAAASVAAAAERAVVVPPKVPAAFQGTWVPTKAACDSPQRMLVGADRLTLRNGADRESLGGIEMAGPGYFPPSYHGIMAVLITEFDGQQPATVTFNVGERKGVAMVEFVDVVPGRATTPQLAAYNARIGRLALGKRFPFGKTPLKRCAPPA